jgi:hypothetical protein
MADEKNPHDGAVCAAQIKVLADQVAVLEAKADALAAHSATLEQRLAALEAAAQPSQAVTTKRSAEPPKVVEFELKKKVYRLRVPSFQLGNRIVLAEQVAKDKTLQEKILADHPGLVVEVTE